MALTRADSISALRTAISLASAFRWVSAARAAVFVDVALKGLSFIVVLRSLLCYAVSNRGEDCNEGRLANFRDQSMA